MDDNKMKDKIKNFDLKNTTFYHYIDKTYNAKIYFHKCSQCGKLITVFCFEDNSKVGSYEGHSRSFGTRFLNGGRSGDHRLLCRHCLDMGKLIDEVKNLEERKEYLRNEIAELGDKMEEIVKFVKS